MVRTTTAGQLDAPRPDSGLVRRQNPLKHRCREGFTFNFSWHKSRQVQIGERCSRQSAPGPLLIGVTFARFRTIKHGHSAPHKSRTIESELA